MKRILALVGLLLFLDAFAAETTQFCSVTQKYIQSLDECGPGSDEDCCTPDLTNPTPGGDVLSTTFDGEVTTDKTNGTLYACYWPTSTSDRTHAEIIAGTGCTSATATQAVSAAGAYSFSFTGAAANTEYKVGYAHLWDSDGTTPRQVSYLPAITAPFRTPTGGGAGGDDLTGTCFVVDASPTGCGGTTTSLCSDSNTGTSVANAWLTLSKVNSAVTARGSDVCLMDGSVFGRGDDLDFDWGGAGSADGFTPSDLAIVQTVYEPTNNPGELYAYDDGDFVGRGAKAQIRGNLDAATADAGTYNWDAYPQGGCSSAFDALVDIDDHYSVIRNVEIIESGCSAINAKFPGTSGQGTNDHRGVRIESNDMSYIGFTAVVMEVGQRACLIRKNTLHDYAKCEQSERTGGNTPTTPVNNCGSGGWPGGMTIRRSGEAYCLFEENYIYKGYGEGLSVSRVSHAVFRGNRIGNTLSNPIYAQTGYPFSAYDDTNHIIAEHNLIWDGDDDHGAGPGTSTQSLTGLNVSMEDFSLGSDTGAHMLSRNNIHVGRNHGAEVSLETNARAANKPIRATYYGNTFIEQTGGNIDADRFNSASITTQNGEMITASNLFYKTVATSSDRCQGSSTNDYNVWNIAASLLDNDCEGANDVYSADPDFATTLSHADWLLKDWADEPTVEDVRLGASSDALGAGDPTLENKQCIDPLDTNWDNLIALMSYPFAPNGTTWRYCLGYDFEGTARNATAPDAGAVERP